MSMETTDFVVSIFFVIREISFTTDKGRKDMKDMENLNAAVAMVDGFVWGPVMLILLVGTGIFLTVRTGFLTWRNLPYAIKSTLSKEARTQNRGEGDVSPFSALTTALAATIGTGNIVGVATAMVSGGPGALVWMWISAAFGKHSGGKHAIGICAY